MDENRDAISNFLETETGVEFSEEKRELAEINHSRDDIKKNAKDDYENVRRSLLDLINSGTSSFDKMIKLANESESPRAFEVLSNMMKTIAEVNKDLMALHKETKVITEEKVNDDEQGDTIVFQGSTEELQRFLKQRKQEVLESNE